MTIAPSTVAAYREMASMLGWHRCREVWMLWGFFDESYEDNGPNVSGIKHLTIGGFVASSENWEALTIEWSALLIREGVDYFHMTDFEARQGQFSGWENERHKRFMTDILDIIVRHVSRGFGSTIEMHDKFRPQGRRRGRNLIRQTYQHSLEDILWNCGQHANTQNDRIALVFARQKDVDWRRAVDAFEEFQATIPRFHSISTMSPIDNCPLQAADLMAYEASRAQRNIHDHEADFLIRDPLRVLMEAKIVGSLQWVLYPPAVSARHFLKHPPPGFL